MAKLLAFPITISGNGSMGTINDGEDYYAQELACLVGTQIGERELVPGYGVPEVMLSTIDRMNLGSQCEIYGPPIKIVRLAYKYDTKTSTVVAKIEWVPDARRITNNTFIDPLDVPTEYNNATWVESESE